MTKPVLASAFCQVAWVARDLAAAEKFFIETMGIRRFMHMDNLAAKDTEGTYLGKQARELGLQPAYRLRGRHADRTDPACLRSQHVPGVTGSAW